MKAFIMDMAWTGFKVSFGLTSLAAVWVNAGLKNGALWAKDTEAEKKELALSQARYWGLEREPLLGFRHAFFTTRAGVRVHYVTNAKPGEMEGKNVAIFIHGFPDSFLLWRHILQSPALHGNHILIAVDLPGYGGSDSLPNYGAYEVLETMAEFILDMRKQYLQTGGKVVIATHDWGALVGARLASEAAHLADHWVISSGMIPHLTASNSASQMVLFKQMLRTWLHTPLNFRLLKTAFATLIPVGSQFRKSFYIFCFLLPWPFSGFFATFGNYWWLRILHSLDDGKAHEEDELIGRLDPKKAGEAMTMSAGPSPAQLTAMADLRYGESVRKRVADRGMSQKIGIYRHGLFVGKWEKSLETTAALFELAPATQPGSFLGDAPQGALKAPTTFILGERDPAFDQRLVLGNIKDYLVRGSQVMLVKDAGHWLPLESDGRVVLEKSVQWALDRQTKATPFPTMSEVKVVMEI
ncbi:hypothetical protein ACEQ8H_005219 [Pleosporales sp. CAS-2024a]